MLKSQLIKSKYVMVKILAASVISGLFLISASAFADYSQTQNKVDDKMNAPKPVQANPADKTKGSDGSTENLSQPQSSDKSDGSKSSSDSQRSGSQNPESKGSAY